MNRIAWMRISLLLVLLALLNSACALAAQKGAIGLLAGKYLFSRKELLAVT